MTTQTFYEVQDAHGRNAGECYDSNLCDAIARARFMQKEVPELGRVSVRRVHERMVPERIEVELVELEAGRIVKTTRGRASMEELGVLARAGATLELEAA